MANESRKRKNRLGRCDICKLKDAIYTCPRCETVSCGLDCVKRHKKELDCDGVRVRTKYIPKDKLDEHSILSDYRLLEDIRRCVEGAERYSTALETFHYSVPDAEQIDPPFDKQSFTRDAKTEKVIQEDTTKVESKSASKQPEENCGKKKAQRKRKNNRNKGNQKHTTTPPFAKTEILIAKSKRIKQKILQHGQNKDVSTGNPLPNIESDGSTDLSIPTETTLTNEEVSNSKNSESKIIYSNQENFNASLQLKKSFRTELIGPSEDKVEISEEKAVESQPQTCVQNKSCKIEAELKKNAIFARIRRKIVSSIRQGGKRKEMLFEGLQKAALTRGVVLNSLPDQFKRHWENTSFYFARENLIYWHLRLTFLNAECYTLSLSECSEALTLETLIQRCLNRSRNFHRKQIMSDPLQTYKKLGISNISVLLTAERLRNSQRKFYILDLKKSLKENFEGKCIVEFPQLCVVLKDCHAVATVSETVSHNFFDDFDNDEIDSDINELGKPATKKPKTKTGKQKKEKVKGHNNESDRESGELTDSSDAHSSDSEQSEGGLFQESEFRSIYKDLLKTFDTDVSKSC